MSISPIVFGKSAALLVMKRSARALTAVARWTASAARSRYAASRWHPGDPFTAIDAVQQDSSVKGLLALLGQRQVRAVRGETDVDNPRRVESDPVQLATLRHVPSLGCPVRSGAHEPRVVRRERKVRDRAAVPAQCHDECPGCPPVDHYVTAVSGAGKKVSSLENATAWAAIFGPHSLDAVYLDNPLDLPDWAARIDAHAPGRAP
jgi:hypothetical protein